MLKVDVGKKFIKIGFLTLPSENSVQQSFKILMNFKHKMKVLVVTAFIKNIFTLLYLVSGIFYSINCLNFK